MSTDNLFSPDVTGHCFFSGRCKHTVTGPPDWAHAEMEQHYRDIHDRHISDLLLQETGRRAR